MADKRCRLIKLCEKREFKGSDLLIEREREGDSLTEGCQRAAIRETLLDFLLER